MNATISFLQAQRILSTSPSIVTKNQLTSNIICFRLPFINYVPPRADVLHFMSFPIVDATVLPPYTTVGPSPIILCTPYVACHHALFQLPTWSVERDASRRKPMINQTLSKQANFRIPVFELPTFLRVLLSVLASTAISRSFILRRESGGRVFAGNACCLGVQVPFKARFQDIGNFVLACVDGDLGVTHRDTDSSVHRWVLLFCRNVLTNGPVGVGKMWRRME